MNNKLILITSYFVTLILGLIMIYFDPISISDKEYVIHAKNILSGNGFSQSITPPYEPEIYRSPGIGIFYSVIFYFFGPNLLILKLFQSILNAFIPIFIFYIIKNKFHFNITIFITILVSLYPFTTLYVSVLTSESLCLFFFCLGMFLLRKRSNTNMILSGLVFGFCLLIRPSISLMPLFITFAFIWLYGFEKTWRGLMLFNFSFLLIWSPWVIRNYFVTDQFVPLTIESKEIIFWATGSIGEFSENRESNPKFINQFNEIHQKANESKLIGNQKLIYVQDLYLKYAMRNIRDSPLNWIINSFKKIPRIWISKTIASDNFQSYGYEYLGGDDYFSTEIKDNIFHFIKYILSTFFILACVGVCAFRKHIKRNIFILIPIIYFTITHMFVHVEARYSLPGRPFLTIFSAIGIIFFINLLRSLNNKQKYEIWKK